MLFLKIIIVGCGVGDPELQVLSFLVTTYEELVVEKTSIKIHVSSGDKDIH